MHLRHVEWLIGEPVPDPELIVYEVLPYAPVQADRIIERLCGLAGLEVGQAGDDPVRAERVRRAFAYVVDAARARQALLDLSAIESGLGKPPWRELLKELRRDPRRFAAAIGDKSARIALRWALRDLGMAGRAGPRWLHLLRDNRVVLRKAIDRALEAQLLQRDAGRSDRHDLVVLVEGVGRAYQHLTGKPLGRSLTAEQRPSGPGVRLVRLCLKPPNQPGVERPNQLGLAPPDQPGLERPDQPVTDDGIVWAIRRAQDQRR